MPQPIVSKKTYVRATTYSLNCHEGAVISSVCSAEQNNLQICAELRLCQRWVTNRHRRWLPWWQTGGHKERTLVVCLSVCHMPNWGMESSTECNIGIKLHSCNRFAVLRSVMVRWPGLTKIWHKLHCNSWINVGRMFKRDGNIFPTDCHAQRTNMVNRSRSYGKYTDVQLYATLQLRVKNDCRRWFKFVTLIYYSMSVTLSFSGQ